MILPGIFRNSRLTLELRDALTFKIWKIFREAFPEVAELDHSYQVRIAAQPTERPSGELASIHRQITTLPFPALTNIDIRNLRLRHVHLMDLTNFPNLAVLALEQNLDQAGPRGESGIDEQFMKRWALLVREKKAFLKLTVIIFRHFRIALDSTLDCFGSFPCLLLCNADTIYPLQNPAGMAKTWQPLSIEWSVRVSISRKLVTNVLRTVNLQRTAGRILRGYGRAQQRLYTKK